MRMSSWVFRSGAFSESIWLSHAFCAACNDGKTSSRGPSNGKFQSCWSCALGPLRPEHGDRHVLRGLLEQDLERHADFEGVEIAVDDVGHHARAFFEVDDGRHVRHPFRERR
jgi:hypothetical protein